MLSEGGDLEDPHIITYVSTTYDMQGQSNKEDKGKLNGQVTKTYI